MGGDALYRAIIVDDEPFMLEGMRLMIDWKSCGFELCAEASSAQAALHLVDSLHPHLLITDVRMPGMLGSDLAAIVSHYHPEVVILFFSVFKDFTYAQSAIRSHAFGYLLKPIDADEVQATLRQVKAELDRRAASEPATESHAEMLRDQVLRRIAYGDDSPESLMRAAVLLELKRGDPCYCAVLVSRHGAVPESVKLLLSTCGATPFLLAPNQYGLGFRQIEQDLNLLTRLMDSLSALAAFTLSVGQVHRGAKGFAQSLREALDAQGVLFQPLRGLRLYHPFDTDTAAWLAAVRSVRLSEALADEDPSALSAALSALNRMAKALQPGMFALRYMAATVGGALPVNGAEGEGAALAALWREDALPVDAWLSAFGDALTRLRRVAASAQDTACPPPVMAALAAIRTRYAEPLSMGSVAEELHMNPAYLGQLVRRHTGETFHNRLLDTRIGHACVLLRQTAQSIGEVAAEVGFRDVDYFSQRFRSRMGMSPVAYRCSETAKEGEHAPRQ
ncbi:MAG TPA: response regulator [Candidatus Limiplasma sp.]|nr:response regulator [Candidatus Limiplasma sp.]